MPTDVPALVISYLFILYLFLSPLYFGPLNIPLSTAVEHELLSNITSDTPISGFYGPGSWWAWLITVGMTHGHAGVTLLRTEELPSGWDYDLIGASSYVVAAAIDLILKSRTIARLGDASSESLLLPALVCAERVVWVGTGSSLFTLVLAYNSRSSHSSVRAAGIALTTLVCCSVATGFSRRAHEAIARTARVFWCLSHKYNKPGDTKSTPFTFVHFPADLEAWWTFSYIPLQYWIPMVAATGIIIACAFMYSVLLRQRSLTHAAWFALWNPLLLLAVLTAGPCIACLGISIVLLGIWGLLWMWIWLSVYILAFFPHKGYFPITGMSVLDMDQIAALLPIAITAIIRIVRALHKVAYSRPEYAMV
jgi:hypothetical protein